MSVGFIRDKLEIKFLILYVAAGVAEPMPLSDVQALTMIDDGIDYFDFSQCLSELVKTDHLRLNEHQQYVITPKGLKNSKICKSSLPLSVRLKADKLIAAHRQELIRRAQVRSTVERRENGTYTVELNLNDDVDNVMRLQLMVATKEMAEDLAQRFQKNPEQVAMTKRTIIPLLIAALVALLLPWLAVTFAKGDNGMAVIFLLFFAVNPITAVLLVVFSGGNVRMAWFQPLLFAALFLLGTWVFFTMAEMAFVLYAAAYLILGYAAMLLTWCAAKRKRSVQ